MEGGKGGGGSLQRTGPAELRGKQASGWEGGYRDLERHVIGKKVIIMCACGGGGGS
jgi:hypothetical protein